MKNIKLNECRIDTEEFSEYLNLAKYLIPKNVFDCKPIQLQEWGKVKKYQHALNKQEFGEKELTEMFTDFTGIESSKVGNLKVIDYFYQLKWIIDELFNLSEKEQKVLNSILTPEQLEAGFEDLNRFGYFSTLHALAGKDVTKHDEVERQTYEKIFAVLYLEKVSNDIDKNYHDILIRNSKV